MKLYHGTNGAWLNSILTSGLEPRGSKAARNNWKHGSQSNPKCVYLTDSYAPYIAFNATRGKDASCAVIEIDTDLLDQERLTFDEDAWEQLGRGRDGVVGNIRERTLWYRKRQLDPFTKGMFSAASGATGWCLSLDALGTCAYEGTIPSTAITRAVLWPHRPNIHLCMVWDPSITILNQQFCGLRYKVLTRKLFDAEFTDLKSMTAALQMEAMQDVEKSILPAITGYQLIVAKD